MIYIIYGHCSYNITPGEGNKRSTVSIVSIYSYYSYSERKIKSQAGKQCTTDVPKAG